MAKPSPPGKRRREKENAPASTHAKGTTVKTTRRGKLAADTGPTPLSSRMHPTAVSPTAASAVSASTAFPRGPPLSELPQPQTRQRVEETTSPRLDSRLARRPGRQFPCALQPFRILPQPPGQGDAVSVAEANRRIQQAQALSERQQHFSQLIDLASAGYIPERQCGDAPAAAAPPAAHAAPPPAELEPPEAPPPGSPGPQPAAAAVHRPPRRLVGGAGPTVMPSRSGRGCIRVLRMEP